MIGLLTAIDLAVALVLGGVGVYAIAQGRRVVVEMRGVKATVEGIDKAVNGRPEGEPKLYDLVRAQGLKLDDSAALGHRTAGKVEELAIKVDAHLAHHQAESDRAAARRR